MLSLSLVIETRVDAPALTGLSTARSRRPVFHKQLDFFFSFSEVKQELEQD